MPNWQHKSILKVLEEQRVLAVSAEGERITLEEACDNYFSVTMTRVELIGLATELVEIARAVPIVRASET